MALGDVFSAFAPHTKASLNELSKIMGMPGKPDTIDGTSVEDGAPDIASVTHSLRLGLPPAAACKTSLQASTSGVKLWSNSRITMGLNWASVKAHHVTQACELLSGPDSPRSKSGSLVVTYRGKNLPAKAVLRLAYCLANNIPSETNLKFASSEGSIKLLRSLGFQAQRLQPDHPVPEKD